MLIADKKEKNLCLREQRNGFIGEKTELSDANAQNVRHHTDAWIRRIVQIAEEK